MNHIIDFYLVQETNVKDSTGQTTTQKTYVLRTGIEKSVYEREFYQADQSGLRPQGIVEISSFDYANEAFIKIGTQEYSIYRTYHKGTDRIELYYGERVGNKNG